ncbi:hypothetical protein QUA35_05550 [Microcoleus sp. N9_B2]|uniref:hypothetical protein n=1 Tax=unclassified Microcoleus TaxID=2642155 RepID=UPI002FD1EBD2
MKYLKPQVVAVFLGTVLFSTNVQAREPIGDLNLSDYCEAQGFESSQLSRKRVGTQAAYENWFCVKGNNRKIINLESACQWQYPNYQVFAWPFDPDDAYSWKCFERITPNNQRFK